MHRLFPFLLLVLMALPARAGDDGLKPLADALAKVRGTHGVNELYDAGPELSLVKQALRVWLEPQLPDEPKPNADGSVIFPSQSDYDALANRLNAALARAGLTCGDEASPKDPCSNDDAGGFNARGYVGGVSISSQDSDRYLLVVTDVGMQCGFDNSLYVYERGADRKWQLLLASEQDDYGKDKYSPQHFLSISVSRSVVAWNKPAPPPLVLTLGYSPWCSSNWHSLFTRLWRATPATPTPAALIDRTDSLFMGDYDIASARLTREDVLVEFRGASIDGGTFIRSHVEHYRIGKDDKPERIAPVALNPNDFIEEWLTNDWAEAQRWIDPGPGVAISEALHGSLRKGLVEFPGPAKRCRSDATLWQVSFASREDAKDDAPGPPKYFLVRWMAPYLFTLADLRRKPSPGCDQDDERPDDIGTLFPEEGWKP